MKNEPSPSGFDQLGLTRSVLDTLDGIGYETPSPIQERVIPFVMEGRDVIGQAQTGTGKTAAFALPLVATIDVAKTKKPQALVLTPTRELAIQVAEAFQKYASGSKNFHVLPIYGGQDFGVQLRQLKRGAHVIVGTPGRVMDHIRRETLDLSELSCVVLDEADEMLRMGFIDDVEWILSHTPKGRQIALFSATMPEPIRRIAQRYLDNPEEIKIESKASTADTVGQRFWMVSGLHKLDALTRILEFEEFDGMIIFVRTKTATAFLAEKLEARGFAAEPISGDVSQVKRERTIQRLKEGKLDILVATDVAARGLDVERITHVINYDIPYDTESYVHRIGRTGRAGRAGEAILFVSPRERRLLHSIERATGKRIERMDMPSVKAINDIRIERFKQKITDTLAEEGLEFYQNLIEQYRIEKDVPSLEIAAALLKMQQGEVPLLVEEKKGKTKPEKARKSSFEDREPREPREFGRRSKESSFEDAAPAAPRKPKKPENVGPPIEGMERFRIDAGYSHGLKPGNVVGAIANEAGLESQYIGRIELYDEYSTVDLPVGMPREILQLLKKTWVAGRQMSISRIDVQSKKNRGRKDRDFERDSKKPHAPSDKKKKTFGPKSPRRRD